jgi:hypothetical protein
MKGTRGIKIMLPKLNNQNERLSNKKESSNFINAWNNDGREGSNLNYSVSYSLNYSLTHSYLNLIGRTSGLIDVIIKKEAAS